MGSGLIFKDDWTTLKKRGREKYKHTRVHTHAHTQVVQEHDVN